MSVQPIPRPRVPESILVPEGEELILVAHATGVQIYVCRDSGGEGLVWDLKGPEAMLSDSQGNPVGSHSAGPTWKHSDGSQVAGKVVGRADAPGAGDIPWLLLSASGHSGTGVLSRVSSIQRIQTRGGAPPAACDSSALGVEVRVPYSADYYFYERR